MEKEEKKKINSSSIIVTIIIVSLLAATGYLTYTRIIEHQNKNNNQVINTQDKQKVVEEDKIAIPAVKKDIVDKISTLLLVYYNKNNDSSFNADAYGLNIDLFKNLTIDDNTKAYSALRKAEENSKTRVNIQKNKITVKEIIDNYEETQENNTDFYQIDAKNVNDIYTDLYNSNITNKDNKGKCPSYYYDSANNVYYSAHVCGGIDPNMYLINMDSIYTNKDGAYAIVYLGFIDVEDNNCKNNVCSQATEINVYDGYEKNNLVKKIDINKASTYLMEEADKEQYSKYKISFKQNNEGNYYFDKIEKIEK